MRTPLSAVRYTFASWRWPHSSGRDVIFTLKTYLNPSLTFLLPIFFFKKALIFEGSDIASRSPKRMTEREVGTHIGKDIDLSPDHINHRSIS